VNSKINNLATNNFVKGMGKVAPGRARIGKLPSGLG